MQTVNDLMTVLPCTVAPDTSLSRAWDIMRQENIRQLPVVDGSKLIGIVTERDIRSVLRTDLFVIGTVEMVMTENPIAVSPDLPAYQAAAILRAYKFGALPVIDQGQLVGIVSVSDFLDSASAPNATATSIGEI